jgi:hypothetical protein
MPYTRRRTWPDKPDDYVIRCDGHDVGRVYRTRVPEGDRWQWSIYIAPFRGSRVYRSLA